MQREHSNLGFCSRQVFWVNPNRVKNLVADSVYLVTLLKEILGLVIGYENGVHQRVKLGQMAQHEGEAVRKCLNCLQVKAEWCEFKVTGTCPCAWELCYNDAKVLAQLLQCLKNQEFWEKIFTKGEKITLDQSLVLLKTLERGCKDSMCLNKASWGQSFCWEARGQA